MLLLQGSRKKRIWLDTDADKDFLKYTFTFTKQLFFISNIVFTVGLASRPRRRSCYSAYPFISVCAKDSLKTIIVLYTCSRNLIQCHGD